MVIMSTYLYIMDHLIKLVWVFVKWLIISRISLSFQIFPMVNNLLIKLDKILKRHNNYIDKLVIFWQQTMKEINLFNNYHMNQSKTLRKTFTSLVCQFILVTKWVSRSLATQAGIKLFIFKMAVCLWTCSSGIHIRFLGKER